MRTVVLKEPVLAPDEIRRYRLTLEGTRGERVQTWKRARALDDEFAALFRQKDFET